MALNLEKSRDKLVQQWVSNAPDFSEAIEGAIESGALVEKGIFNREFFSRMANHIFANEIVRGDNIPQIAENHTRNYLQNGGRIPIIMNGEYPDLNDTHIPEESFILAAE